MNENNIQWFEKGGKRAVVGEIRVWGGIRYVKHADGWVVLPKNKTPYLIDSQTLRRHDKHSEEHEQFGRQYQNNQEAQVTLPTLSTNIQEFPVSVTDDVLFIDSQPVIIEDEKGGIRIGDKPLLEGRENNRLVEWLKASLSAGRTFSESIINFRDYYKELAESTSVFRDKYYSRDIKTVNNFLKYLSEK
jgi:hypothetical protein